MQFAALGLREETGPYRDARVLLVMSIRANAIELRREGRQRDGVAQWTAVAKVVGGLLGFYPTLARAFDRARIERLHTAIVSTASSDKRIPWKQIAAVWTGISKGEVGVETWRQAWRQARERDMQLLRS
jgi:hypothetical protein